MNNGANIEFIFGGSFDPVHFGHINVIEKLRQTYPEWPIRLLPCAVPPLKDATGASFSQRVDMLSIVTTDIKNVLIDERENKRNGKSYTLDSLKSLSEEYPLSHYVLVVGADTLKSMYDWYQWQQLKDYCHLLLVNRPGSLISDVGKLMRQLGFSCSNNAQELEKMPSGHYYCLNIEEKDISSTGIRSQLQKGLSVEHLIPGKVVDYIKKNLIYQQETLF